MSTSFNINEIWRMPVFQQARNVGLLIWDGMDRYIFGVQWLVKILLLYPIFPAVGWKILNKAVGVYNPKFLLIFTKITLADLPGGVSQTAWYSWTAWWLLWTVGTYFALPREGLVSTEIKPWLFTAFWFSLGCLIVTAFVPIVN